MKKMKALIEAIKLVSIILLIYCSYFIINTEIEKSQQNITYEIKDKYKEDKLCLREMLWHEARGVSYKEKLAIAEVAINRSNSTKYPSTICEVIKQPKQFSFLNNKNKSKIILPEKQEIIGKLDQQAYAEIEEIVDNYFSSGNIPSNKVLPENALFYHTKNIKNKPKWSRSKKIKQIAVDKQFVHRYYIAVNK